MIKVAGIGSRDTPKTILSQMTSLGIRFANLGWCLRSGGADGADTAFEIGCDQANGAKEIFLPWKGMESKRFPKSQGGHSSTLYNIAPYAFHIASQIHPVWDDLSQGMQKLHARNVHQILGENLDDPVKFVVCWTKNGKLSGGTATAMQLAYDLDIPVFNLAECSSDDVLRYADRLMNSD